MTCNDDKVLFGVQIHSLILNMFQKYLSNTPSFIKTPKLILLQSD